MARWGDYELDEPARQLRRADEVVHLEPQAFDVLVHLVHHRDRVVSKAELLDEVWGHRYVSESALTTRIKEVRRAVGDDGVRQAVVANVRGRGYRFVPELDDDTRSDGGPPAPGVAPGPGGDAGDGSALVGRTDDADGVLDRLARGRLVTVVGPGGVGKTTLAREVARRWAAERALHVRTVPLAEVADAGSVVGAVAEATGVMVDGDDLDRLVGALAQRDELVVLDNCEHVAAEVARLVGRLLDLEGPVRVLATSRERLGTSQELVWPLLPLPAGDARGLFLARAEAAHPGLVVDLDRVDRVVAALDGLPLALEMAAAQLSAMTLGDLEALIGGRTELLRSPDRSAPPRHRTLGALVGWSLDLLTPEERAAFAQLSVFAGAATAPDAAAVLGGDPDDPADAAGAAADLAGLAARSLLAADTSGSATRYRMPETVKAVAATELAAGPDLDVVARRHAHHFLDVAQAGDQLLRGPAEAAAHQRLTDAIPELRAAYRWGCDHEPGMVTELAAALHLFTYSRLWAEPADWARVLGHRDDPTLAAVRAADAANRSRLDEAVRLATEALAGGDRRARGIATEVLSDAALYQGDLAACETHARALQRLGEQDGDVHLQVVGLLNAALSRAYAGRLDEAAPAVEAMLALEPELAPSDQGWCDYAEGEVAAAATPGAGNVALARAIDMAEVVGNRLLASVARTSLASGLVHTGELRAALGAFATCLDEAVAHGNSTHAATTLRNLVDALLLLDDPETAALLLGALAGDGVKATYGAEAARVAAARAAIESGAGTGATDRWLADGAALGLEGGLRAGLRAVEHHLGG